MAVRSREEYTSALKAYLKDDVSDAALALLEDFSDTYDSVAGEDWKSKYEQNDADWRKKYADRFSGAVDQGNLIQPDNPPTQVEETIPIDVDVAEDITVDDLFDMGG